MFILSFDLSVLSSLIFQVQFRPSSSSLKNLPELTSIAKISSPALLAAVGLHNLSFSKRNLSTLQRAAPLDQISKETTNQSSDLWKGSVIKVTRLTKLTRPGITPTNQHLQQTPRGSSLCSHLHRTCEQINTLNLIFSLSVFCMWVRLATKTTDTFLVTEEL
ncbi:hypothetical protein AMECASPLE_027477, partial [Ameca splendens]